MIDLSIIIPSYNTKEILLECLNSIQNNSQDINLEIIVVDNNSTDGTVEDLKKISNKYISAIFLEKNFGFAYAVNRGIEKAKGRYILLLNSDIKLSKDSLMGLINFAENNQNVGLVAPMLLNPDLSIQPSIYHFPSIIGAIKEYYLRKKGSFEKYSPNTKEPIIVDCVVGAAMLIPKSTIEKIGYLDEKYFMYFEDLDYCRRVKRASLRVYYLPKIAIIHKHGASGKKSPTNKWLIESSKKYHGLSKYYLLTFIIWLSQKINIIK
jgi:GT2 family glycosyltransferase